ncbi:MAG: helix-turn-helix transcriptional regulator, partial [Muribaculaceae bacterium]|nr:helix-turn-helix transcriptional regulator [Muribaculaceae bacterium]
AEFAEALGVSRSLLNKKLQSLMGQSANQLIRTYRLRTAYELIVKNRKTRSMNVTEIAFQVGFNDSKYFTRCFTKQYGVAPSAVLKGENPPDVTPESSTF